MEKSELLKCITKAWKDCVEDYKLHRINSERSLQASLWSKLVTELSLDKYPIFIEPGLKIKGKGKVFPDIVVCDDKSVIGIIELKYQPRALPGWEKDIDTLNWIHQHREKLIYKHRRHEGPEREFTIGEDVLYVWAGIHLPLGSEIVARLDEEQKQAKFSEFHFETKKRTKHPVDDATLLTT